jgi:hypothetical protein
MTASTTPKLLPRNVAALRAGQIPKLTREDRRRKFRCDAP